MGKKGGGVRLRLLCTDLEGLVLEINAPVTVGRKVIIRVVIYTLSRRGLAQNSDNHHI